MPLGGQNYCGTNLRFPKDSKERIKFYNKWLEQFGDFKCFYCDVETSPHHEETHNRKTTIDHLVPKSKGGLNKTPNLVIACFNCNQKKQNLTLEEFLPIIGKVLK